jgi:hypothetical protein
VSLDVGSSLVRMVDPLVQPVQGVNSRSNSFQHNPPPRRRDGKPDDHGGT